MAYPLNAEGLASCSQHRRNSLLWSAVAADHGGTTVYHTAKGKPHTWLLLGALPASYTLTEPDSACDTWEGGQWQLDESAQLAARKRALLQYASTSVAFLQDAVELDIASDAEI